MINNTSNHPQEKSGGNYSITVYDFLASGFYSGRSPVMPGTCGTIVAAVLVFLLWSLVPNLANFLPGVIFASLFTIFAIAVSNACLRYKVYGKDNKDPQIIVIDEFAGYLFAIIGLENSISSLVVAFVLFRIFDMSKPPPINSLEKLPRAYGIVLDDVAAGIYANLLAHLCFYFI